MMHRRTVLRTLLGSVIATFAAPFSLAGQPAKIPRVGVLSPGSPGPSPLLAAFHQGLRDLGYVEKQTILLEYRFAETRLDRLPGLAADLVAGRVDVIVTVNNTASRAALNATKTIPIIVTWVADPAALVANLARPEGNITGLTSVAAELSAKRFEILTNVLPGVSRVAVLWNSANPMATSMVREMDGLSPRLGVQLHPVGVRDASELQDGSPDQWGSLPPRGTCIVRLENPPESKSVQQRSWPGSFGGQTTCSPESLGVRSPGGDAVSRRRQE